MTIDHTKVTRTRAAIAAGTYLTDAKLDIAAGRVLDVLCRDIGYVPAVERVEPFEWEPPFGVLD